LKKEKTTDNVSSTADDEHSLEAEDKVSPKLKSCLKTPSKTLADCKDKNEETKKSSARQRRQTIASRDELARISPQQDETNKTPVRTRLAVTSRDELAKSSAAKEETKGAPKDIVSTPKKVLRSRSKSCYMDRPEELEEPLSKKEKNPKNNEFSSNSFK